MDILTPRGQESRKWEDRAVELWSSHYPQISYVSTDKNSPCAVDAILVKDQQIIGVVEQKSRPSLTVVEFMQDHKAEWLVTYQKLKDGQAIAEALCTKFVGFLYLPEADILMFKTLWSKEQGWATPMRVLQTRTQATINGGSAVRENAFINMADATVLYGDTVGRQTSE